ncbi:MAG: 1,2-phenylacetyl-CoA epoxidase subunit PaaC [Actinomycetota bacterium]
MSDSLVALVVALADDELVLGHRHSEWTGHAPHIEEDVAFSSIAQDEIGHAAALFRLAAELTGDDPDRLALGRAADGYRHAVLCERENDDWAFTLARHWLYDHADALRLEVLADSKHEPLAALAEKMRREERYHLLHADTWMRRVAGGPVEGRTKLIAATSRVLHDAPGLFEPVELEDEALAHGWLAVSSGELRARFEDRTEKALDELGMPNAAGPAPNERTEFVASSSGDLIAADGLPEERAAAGDAGLGGRHGQHSPAFAALWETMTVQYQAHPGARW